MLDRTMDDRLANGFAMLEDDETDDDESPRQGDRRRNGKVDSWLRHHGRFGPFRPTVYTLVD